MSIKDLSFQQNLNDNHSAAHIILNNIEDGVFLINNQQKIITFNRGAEKISGYIATKINLKPYHKVIRFVDQHGQTLDESMNPLNQAFTKKKIVRHHNLWIHHKNGQKIPIHLIISPLTNQDNQIKGLIGVMRDMSLEKQVEMAKTDFVSTASHEMRTPLATLEGYLTLLQTESLKPPVKTYVQKAHQTVMYLGELFKDLLTTSQSEDGRLNHQPKTFNLARFIEKMINEEYLKLAAEKEISLQFNKPHLLKDKKIYKIYADKQRIKELLSNVLNNALKYTKNKGKITIDLKQVDNFVQIIIADTGLGIAAEDLPHLFQKFYRVSNDQPGSGLGLFICKKIVELYKGDIWLQSQLGQGSAFYINLPLKKSLGR